MRVVQLWVTLFAVTVGALFIAAFGVQATGARFVGDQAAYGSHVLLFLLMALLLCGAQVLIIWQWYQLGQRWWRAIVVEVLLACGIAITSSQALGGSSSQCYDARCSTTYPTYLPVWWIVVCCAAGLVIGCVWSSRPPRTEP